MTSKEITVARDTLAPALGRAVPLILNRTTLPALSCIKLDWSDGELRLTASNLDAWISESITVTTGEPWKGCDDAHQLDRFVRSLPKNGDVRLTADDTTLTIATVAATARLG